MKRQYEPWFPPAEGASRHIPRLFSQLRLLQDLVAGSRPDDEAAQRAAEHVSAANALLRAFQVPERLQIAGRRPDLPAEGQTFLPPIDISHKEETRVTGFFRFSRFYLGANGAVHGGAIPLVFDSLFGFLVRQAARPRARTAYLTVNYREVTPIEQPLDISAEIVKEEGRKIFVSGSLETSQRVAAEAEALLVILRPGQA